MFKRKFRVTMYVIKFICLTSMFAEYAAAIDQIVGGASKIEGGSGMIGQTWVIYPYVHVSKTQFSP